mmetsp:Transcript_1812/g.3184  ORF Transcript_1812/g.3184 Transcript_1812/m.3184 type:complete len:294 (+) Transcript_1812:66-947(+)
MVKTERQLEFEGIAADVETWGESILFGERADEEGWKEVKGWKMFNQGNRTRCFLKWLPDSRGEHAEPDTKTTYPCIKLFSTIDAPMSDVCAYLADETHYTEYNALVVEHSVLEDISPHSKICWGVSPKIWFITPREFVNFVSHRWRRSDGMQVVVSQACDHPDKPAVTTPGEPKKGNRAVRAFSLRGAYFLSPHPDDPKNKTKFCFVNHSYPGKEVPHFLLRYAVKVLSPIESFKLMDNINKHVQEHAPYSKVTKDDDDKVDSDEKINRSKKPGGMAMMGFCAFWPNGGGLEE